ncbi:hypothetical protein NEISUBOT_03002 [Neisseria subflava NJ9703]|uniref:Uncharacterized protein n=1 Tax=Neisseria subflava NJ9703 TaxID=546268 RepID=A0A9W5ISJ5_NEISU|nr:hypothetical protein NEISUBOT_03002 [Neisseria subflava NJ9703]
MNSFSSDRFKYGLLFRELMKFVLKIGLKRVTGLYRLFSDSL